MKSKLASSTADGTGLQGIARREFIKRSGLAAGLLALQPWRVMAGPLDAGGDLPFSEAFSRPPHSAKPWVYWYWMQGNITRAGITKDLEAMAEWGLAGPYLFNIGGVEQGKIFVPQPVEALSPEWWSLMDFAFQEAHRVGVQITLNDCDGWALSGGPWITPELSMQELVWTQANVAGGQTNPIVLPEPRKVRDYYRDLAVLAFPGKEIRSSDSRPQVTTSENSVDVESVITGTGKELILTKPGWIQFSFAEPFTCRSVKFLPPAQADIQISDDGQTFKPIGRVKPNYVGGWEDGGMSDTPALPQAEIKARFFRFVFDVGVRMQHIELSNLPRLPDWEGKAGFRWRRSPAATASLLPDDLCVPPERILDLSSRLKPGGKLDWTPPPGDWIVLRFGYTTTGMGNGPGGRGAGLECDKFNPAASTIQFQNWYGAMVKRAGPDLAGKGKTLVRNHSDSWETNCQNWSPVFREQFRQRRGYDPILWLPAMSGVPIGSAEISERFLQDVRRTVADLVDDGFFKNMVRLTHQAGGTYSSECAANIMVCDGLEYFREVDIPMGEFWLDQPYAYDKPNDIADAVSGGHVYGKRIIQAEAFTELNLRWDEHPFFMKPQADFNFAKGINRLVLHVWPLQATEQKPGITLWFVGSFFTRHQTWFKPAKAWIDYLRRTQGVLQQGAPVADVAYLINERLPNRAFLPDDLPLPLPAGYAMDSINGDALLHRAEAKGGRLVLPDGVSYRLLVVPDAAWMSPELAEKVGRIAAAGVPVIANTQPRHPIGLEDSLTTAKQLPEIVAKYWSRVKIDGTPGQFLQQMGLAPDLEFPGLDLKPVPRPNRPYASPTLVWTHRRDVDADAYFIASQETTARRCQAVFRIAGRVPEIWFPDTGRMMDARTWRSAGGRTTVELDFDPCGSCFVVFRRRTSRQSSQPSKVAGTETAPLSIAGPWTVSFPADLGAPESIQLPSLTPLEKNQNPGVKYFSGTATYICTFQMPEGYSAPGQSQWLDLGTVADLAEVSLNGTNLGIAWKPPYRVEATGALRAGENRLEVRVSNTWRNRLVGDALLPKDQQIAQTPMHPTWGFDKNTKLTPSGLLGPVTLLTTPLVPWTNPKLEPL